jgi:methyl-accepting chemotaxis protein
MNGETKGSKLFRITLKVKLIMLFIAINLVGNGIYIYSYAKQIEKEIMSSIHNNLRHVEHYAHETVLKKFHNKVYDVDSVTKDDYDNITLELNKIVSTVNSLSLGKNNLEKEVSYIDDLLDYIYSVIESFKADSSAKSQNIGDVDNLKIAYIYSFTANPINKEIVYTSTSMTKDEMQNPDEYTPFFESYETDATDNLKKIVKNENINDTIYETDTDDYGTFRSILKPYTNEAGYKYVVGVDIRTAFINNHIQQKLNKMYLITVIVFLLSVIAIIITVNIFLRQIPIIKNGVIEFCRYINEESDDIQKINVDSNDELGDMAKVINENIMISKENIIKNNTLVNDIKNVSKHISNGSFKHRVNEEAHRSSYNETKDIINDMLDNIDYVVSQVVGIIGEYSRKNYMAVLEKESYQDELLKLIESVKTLGSNISDEKLQSGNNAILIQKSSNFLGGFFEDTNSLLGKISKEIEKVLERNSSNDKFYRELGLKIKDILQDVKSNKNGCAQVDEIKNKSTDAQIHEFVELLRDVEYSLGQIEESFNSILKDIHNQKTQTDTLREPLLELDSMISGHIAISKEKAKKEASSLSSVANSIRNSILDCNFKGKEQISTSMQHVG